MSITGTTTAIISYALPEFLTNSKAFVKGSYGRHWPVETMFAPYMLGSNK